MYLGFRDPDGLVLLAVNGLPQFAVPRVTLRQRHDGREHVRPQLLQLDALLVQFLAALVRRPACVQQSIHSISFEAFHFNSF